MARGLPISTYVDITTAIQAGGVLRDVFGTGLLVTTDDALPAGGADKAQIFRDIEGVNAVLGAGDALDDATVWFSQAGAKSLYLGRWATTDIATTLRGGAPAAIAAIAFSNAGFVIAGEQVNVNLSADTTYAAIAASIQSAIQSGEVASVTITTAGSGYSGTSTVTFTGGGAVRAATGTLVVTAGAITDVTITDPGSGYTSVPTVVFTGGTGGAGTAVLGAITDSLAGATFTYDTNAFLLTLATAANIDATFGDPTSGTDVSTSLGFGATSRATYRLGHDTESLIDAVGEMLDLALTSTPVALMLGTDAPLTHGIPPIDSREELAAYAQAGDYVFGLLDTSSQALVTGDETSHAALVFGRQQDHVEPVYSMPGTRPDIGLLALMSSQNLNSPASIITPHLKVLPSVLPTNITEAQRAELERKRTNVYTTVGGLPSLVGGFTGRAGSWLDAVWWLLWLKNEMELNIFNAQRGSRRFNTAILRDTISGVMRTAVQSGGANPGGRVNASIQQDIIATTGNEDFDGTLPAGHLTWIERQGARSSFDRGSRIGRFKTWVAPADAIHKVIGDIVLSG